MEQKNAKKHLLIGIPTFIVVIAAIVLLCLFVPKACQKKGDAKLDVACTNSTVDGQTELHNIYPVNDLVTLTFKANDLYSLPSDIKVTSGNQQLVKDTDYTYSDQTGVFTFNIHGDTNVAIEGVESLDITFTINLPANNETEPAFMYNPDIYPHERDYPGTVDWGDGTVNNKMYHRYSSSSEDKIYKVIIRNYTYDHFSFTAGSGYSSNPYLTSINLTHSIKTIGSESFGNSSLTQITIPNSVKKIGSMCFYYCSSLRNVIFENESNLISIHSSAFDGCSSLQYNEYDNALYLGSETNNYYALIKVKDTSITSCAINDNCKIIVSEAFYNSSITSITIGNSVISINDYAFYYCYSLISVNISNSVTTIGNSAFYNCSSLASVTITNSVTSIGRMAFYNINVNATVDMSNVDHLIPLTDNIFCIESSYWDTKFEGTIKVKSSLLETYKTADYWKNYADRFVGV